MGCRPALRICHEFLHNVATRPAIDRFSGCDTPEIGERFRKGRFDVVLVQGWYLKSFLQAAFAAKRQRLPVIVRGDSHLETPRSVLKRTAKSVIYPAVLRLFDAALFVGERSREYWTHYGYPTSRLFFSPHCVDADWFAARATPRARAKLRAQLGIDSEDRGRAVCRQARGIQTAGGCHLCRRPHERQRDGMCACLWRALARSRGRCRRRHA